MITPPIIILEGGDLYIEESLESAEAALEAVDVKDGIYTAYDSAGRLLAVSVTTKQVPIFWNLFKATTEAVEIKPAELDPSHEGELRTALLNYLNATGKEIDLDKVPTKELIQKTTERISA